MNRLIASAVFLAASLFGLVLGPSPTAAAEPNMSSSYSFVKGKGKLPAWKPYFNDHNNYVARDWNKDGRLDVMAFANTHGSQDGNAGDTEGGITYRHSPIVFLSNANSSYTGKKVPGIKNQQPCSRMEWRLYSQRSDYSGKWVFGHSKPGIDN